VGRQRLARPLEPRALVRLPRRAQVQRYEVPQPRLVRLAPQRLVRLLLVAPPRAQVEPPPAPLVWLDLSGHA